MLVTISGSALSSIFLENINKDGDQEGFLLGNIVSTVTEVISDTHISNKKEETTTCIQSFLPCVSTFKFYDNVATVNERRLTSLLRKRRRDVVGWYKFRRNSSFQLSMRERALHQNLASVLNQHAGVFVVFLITACDMPQSTLDHACYQIVDGAIKPIAVQIINLGDTTQSEYKRTPASSAKTGHHIYQDVLDQYTPKFLKDDGSARQVDGIREMNHCFSRKLKALYGTVSQTEESIAILAGEVRTIRLRLRERMEEKEQAIAEKLAREEEAARRLEEARKAEEERERLQRLIQERQEKERIQAEKNRQRKIEEAKRQEARAREEAKTREQQRIDDDRRERQRVEEAQLRELKIGEEERKKEEVRREGLEREVRREETKREVVRRERMKREEIRREEAKKEEIRKREIGRPRQELKPGTSNRIQDVKDDDNILDLTSSDHNSSCESGPSSPKPPRGPPSPQPPRGPSSDQPPRGSSQTNRVGARKPASSYSIPMELDQNLFVHTSSKRNADQFSDVVQQAKTELQTKSERKSSRSQTLGRPRPSNNSALPDSPSKLLRSPSPTY